LDVAKRHLNTSMTTLKRVDMLMNAVHRLQVRCIILGPGCILLPLSANCSV
jgi:hypothetical protein